jgi:hypothetical protein
MSYPIQVGVTFDFSNGAQFGYPLILNDPTNGLIGKGILADTASTIVDISDQVLSIALRGGYDLIQDQFQAGTAQIRISDPNGDWNPQNTNSPYYGKLLPLRKMRVSGTYQGVVYYLFSGYTTTYSYTYPKDQSIGYVDISCVDGFRLFNLANITTVAGAVAGQDTGTRINAILDQVGWPPSMREIMTGGSETKCQADPGSTRTSLQALKNVEFSEQGGFYMDGGGDAVFKSRQYILQSNGANPTYFSNVSGSSDIPYKNVVFAFDDKLIINDAQIQVLGGTIQEAYDSSSQSTYFPHSMTQQNLVAQSDTDANNIARMYVASRSQTAIRIDAMSLDLTTPNYDAGIKAALGLDYFNTVQITNVGQQTGSGQSTIVKTEQIMGMAHDITPNTWVTTFTTRAPINLGFILNSSLYGVLGSSVLAY